MVDKQKISVGVSLVVLAAIILAIIGVCEYRFWWNYTSPLKNNSELVEVIASVKSQTPTEYGTFYTVYEFVFDNTVYTQESYQIPETDRSIYIYVNRNDATQVTFREPFGPEIAAISTVILAVIALLLYLAISPLYMKVFDLDYSKFK